MIFPRAVLTGHRRQRSIASLQASHSPAAMEGSIFTLQIYFVSRWTPFIDVVIVYNQDDFVAGLLDNRDGFSLRDFGLILGLHVCFDGDQLHGLGS